MSRLATTVLVSLALAGCPSENRIGQVRDGNEALYIEDVQPIVQRHCAFEGCHGREGMPLTVYAIDFLRLRDPRGDVDGERPPLDERQLSRGELDHNRRSMAARTSYQDPLGDRMIRRLLPLSLGGIPHGDVVVFERDDDPELETLRSWLMTVGAR